MGRDDEPMLDSVNGDIGMSRHLSKALKILADSPIVADDLQKQLRDILAGRGSLRDLAHSDSFARFSDTLLPKIAEENATRTPQETQRLAAAGESILERYRNEERERPSSTEGTPRPVDGPQPGGQASHASEPRPAATPGSHVIPGTRKPNRDRIVMPDEPDDDDLYFEDRRNRGWLE
ncbi:hypothetical protein [Nocardia cyriacigeorgica]|uniref:hypothetical protein n=1 Tax=Nocardia cyriacigeorgica TaxID=135487 RepID=UPI0024586F1B|nr:hypothetical protein [Nocardia cyriacigeorgica]BDU05192.1 hypothetical protein FMUBM48_14550 [Nocardia cyriacigeorgica]